MTLKEKLWNAKYISIVVVNTLICFGFYMITTILTVYLLDVGIDVSMAGIVVGLFSITALIMRPISGYVTDNFNHKRLMVLSTAVVAISVVGYVITSNLALIFIFRILHGLAFAISSTVIVAMASSYIPESRFSEGIGYLGLGQIIGSAVGPGLGVWIMNQFGTRYAFYIAAVFTLLAMGLIIILHYQAPERPEKTRKVTLKGLIAVEVLDLSFISGCYSYLNGIVGSFLVIMGELKGIADVSMYFVVSSIFLFAARPISGKIVDRFGMKYVIYPAVVLTVISLVMLITMNNIWVLLISAALRALAQGALQPSVQAACIKKVGVERSGAATGTYYLGADIGHGLGPIIGGFIAGIWGYDEILYFSIVLIIISGVVYFFSARPKKVKSE